MTTRKRKPQPVPRLWIGATVSFDEYDGSGRALVGRVIEILIRANDVRYVLRYGRGRSATTETVPERCIEFEEGEE